MYLKTLALLATALIASAAAPLDQPPDDDEQELTPCQEAGMSSVNRATGYMKNANDSTNPFDLVDNTGKACGVVLRGIRELVEMSCPQPMIAELRDIHDELVDKLDRLNDHYGYRFSCFVPY